MKLSLRRNAMGGQHRAHCPRRQSVSVKIFHFALQNDG
jgi:hypothetical protein